MTDTKQYLRIELDGQSFLLPNTASFTIEQRHSLIENEDAESNVGAWRSIKSTRWPAYCLDRKLAVTRMNGWERAVFLDTKPTPVGIIAHTVELMPRTEMIVPEFTPLGTPPTPAGHLFSAAWISDDGVMLVFEPKALIRFLQSLGEE